MEVETNLNTSLNNDQAIHHLSGETTRLISSSQIISSVSSVVKECFENSLDAGATNIQVKLENFGLNLIEVKDDGTGISYENVQKMFLPGFTSKINDYSDLDKLTTYGFRGEALAAVCLLGETSVTTKREQDALAMTYDINKKGEPLISYPSHLPKGTTVTVKNVFNDLPVRKQYASSKKKMTDELKKIEHVVQSLSVIHPQLRVVISHNKSNIWQKNAVKSLKQSFMQVVGLRHASKMDVLIERQGDLEIQLVVPKKDATEVDSLFSSSNLNSFVFVNFRPVTCKEISKAVDDIVGSYWNISDKHVLCLVSVTVAPSEVDVNLEPNKTKIILNNKQEIITLLAESLQTYYGSTQQVPQQAEAFETPRKRIRLDDYVMSGEKTVDITLSDEISALCSQINKDNCVLASDKEMSALNSKFIKNCSKIVTSSITHLSRDDIQGKVSIPGATLDSNAYDGNRTEKTGTNGTVSQNTIFNPSIINNKQINGNSMSDTYVSNCDTYINVDFEGSVETKEDNTNNINDEQININTTAKLHFERNVLNCEPDMNLDFGGTFSTAQKTNYSEVQEPLEFESVLLENCSRTGEVTTARESLFTNNAGITKDTWSRGQIIQQNGKILEGSAVLLTNNKLINSSNSNTAKESKWIDNSIFKLSDDVTSKEIGEDISKFNLSLQSVSSQMGRKEHSGFTKFARIMRPKIIEGNPNIMFTEVSRMLVDRWKLLSSDEKDYYETVAKAVDEERKMHRQQKIAAVPAKPVKHQPQVFALKQLKRPDRKKIQTSVEIEEIINLRSKMKYSQINDSGSYKLLGQLHDHGNWLFLKNQEICGIRHSGLNELILYYKMLTNFSIVTNKLDRPEYLSDANLGKENWNCLLSLDSEFHKEINRYIITSPVIVKNGFRIEIVQSNNQAVTNAFLTEVAIDLEEYGISELKEVLELYRVNGEFPALDKLRPPSVKSYISKEVKRMVKNKESTPDLEEITAQLYTWQQSLKHLSSKCLHEKEIFLPIYKISS